MMTQRNTYKRTASGGLQNISPKVMVMIALLVVMGLLWGRVLLKGNMSPAKANAQTDEDIQEFASDPVPESVQIEAIELPVLPGRNDRISNNLFGGQNWTAFTLDHELNSADSGVEGGDTTERTHRVALERIAGQLKLEAVICDARNQPHQAYVDDKILSVGSTLTVQEGTEKYMLTVEKISKKEVTFSWNEMSVVLKMAETFEF